MVRFRISLRGKRHAIYSALSWRGKEERKGREKQLKGSRALVTWCTVSLVMITMHVLKII